MVDAARARKLADRIKVVVAETLEMRVKDPRLGFITITDVRVTGDLQQATVFYTVLRRRRRSARTPRPRWRARRACCAPRSAGRPAYATRRRWRSSPTRSPRPPRTSRTCSPRSPRPTPRCTAAAAGATLRRRGRPYKVPRVEREDDEDDELDDADGRHGP